MRLAIRCIAATHEPFVGSGEDGAGRLLWLGQTGEIEARVEREDAFEAVLRRRAQPSWVPIASVIGQEDLRAGQIDAARHRGYPAS